MEITVSLSTNCLQVKNRELSPLTLLHYFFFCHTQVSGELSNDGQPMRRFMQTFVLAPGEVSYSYFLEKQTVHIAWT